MNTKFFSLFRVNLKRKCMFWQDKPAEKCSSGSETKKKSAFMTGMAGGLGASSAPNPTSSTTKPKKEVTKCSLSTEGSIPAIPFSPTTNLVDKTGIASSTGPQPSNDCNVPEFWLDMCKDIPTDESEYINLQNNAERYTGFNGAKIWSAIYNENCFSRTGDVQQMYALHTLL